ncbi:hypothetical protein RR46_02389 [Papilio xuthus]|uniref:Uncharacterized protein n=1 Tax=Papilio xuthus TaxID=66420 RepID=A0A194Q0Q9_PAPXU|nr:hypothetical protein RR46_02389 [Papilio xuthus]
MSSEVSAAGQLVVRDGRREDLPAVHRMIYELAAYEGIPEGPQLSVEGESLLMSLPTARRNPFENGLARPIEKCDPCSGALTHKHFLQI